MSNDNLTSEEVRLEYLADQGIMDTPPEEAFDRLTRLACQLFDTTTTLISIMDDTRVWLKSRQGIDACELSRDVTVCDMAIRGRDPFVVPDLSEDPRYCDNPLVAGEPHFRFYAGMPLIMSNGAALGVFCILGYTPRAEWTDRDDQCIRDLAAVTVREIEIRSLGRDALSLLDGERHSQMKKLKTGGD